MTHFKGNARESYTSFLPTPPQPYSLINHRVRVHHLRCLARDEIRRHGRKYTKRKLPVAGKFDVPITAYSNDIRFSIVTAAYEMRFAPTSSVIFVLALLIGTISGQVFNHFDIFAQQNLIAGSTDDPRGAPHPAVVENSLAEAQLPAELLNPFYKNPAIAAGLAKESWFGHKEFPVHNREADKIPRSEILKIVKRLEDHRRK